jgi:flavoprotein
MCAPLQNPEVEHIAVATRADAFLVAPATANILAKAAHGIADDWLSTTLLATRAPVLFAPAMNTAPVLDDAEASCASTSADGSDGVICNLDDIASYRYMRIRAE